MVVILSFYLSNIISKPISHLTEKLNQYDLGQVENPTLRIATTTYELQHLTERFNELLKMANDAFLFT